VQLQGELGKFRSAGIGVVAITYDAPALQQKFIERYSITYPVLSDVGAATMSALRILDPGHPPGDRGYGVPYTGVFVVDRNGRIAGKVFLEGVTRRVDADGVLAYAEQVLR
jgi:peroxiredoxin